jgi:hypothetical protein
MVTKVSARSAVPTHGTLTGSSEPVNPGAEQPEALAVEPAPAAVVAALSALPVEVAFDRVEIRGGTE